MRGGVELPSWMRLRSTGVELRIRLAPRSSRDRVSGTYGDRLKIHLTAVPVGGAANAALEAFLARAAGRPARAARVVFGHKDRSKTVLVECDDPESTASRLLDALVRARA